MPAHCCVPGCKSNYETTLAKGEPSVSAFSFPRDENLRKLWIEAIPRKNWQPSKCSKVCIVHFHDYDINKTDEHKSPIKRGKLFPTAVPSLFPSCPFYLSKPRPPPRKDPNLRRKEILIRQEKIKNDLINANYIINFQNFSANFQSKIDVDGWFIYKSPENIIFFQVEQNEETICNFKVQISINSNLNIRIFLRSVELSKNDLDWISLINKKIYLWSQIKCILDRYKSFDQPTTPNSV